MAKFFETELEDLSRHLLAMGGHAEEAVITAVRAVVERNDALANEIREQDSILDRFEVEIDDMAVQLLAKAPLASDLRLITIAMKISHDLERVGDEATTISRQVIELDKEAPLKQVGEVPAMAKMAASMLKDALDTFLSRELDKARAVVLRDREVDQLNKRLHRELADAIVQDPSRITACLSLMRVSKSLERIADHATNIAEEVVYLYEGRDIRHTLKAGAQ